MQARDLVADHIELVSLPEVCVRIQELADDPDCSLDDFAAVVAHDPSLTARLLKLVNSAFYGFPSRVETVSRAVGLVGILALRNLALATAAVELFTDLPGQRLALFPFWRHSVFCGLVARNLAEAAQVLHGERLFVGGLLHDVGRLLIFSRLPEAAARIQAESDPGDCNPELAERRVLGFDHAEVGGELLLAWMLPQALRESVRHHHRPLAAGDHVLEASLLHLANAATHQVEAQAGGADPLLRDPFAGFVEPPPPDFEAPCLAGVAPAVWAAARIEPGDLAQAVARAGEAFEDTLRILYDL